LGRLDICRRRGRSLRPYLAPCGGALASTDTDAPEQIVELSPSCPLGISAAVLGDLETARAVGAFARRMLDSQPEEDRLYYLATAEGDLITDPVLGGAEVEPRDIAVVASEPEQH